MTLLSQLFEIVEGFSHVWNGLKRSLHGIVEGVIDADEAKYKVKMLIKY